MDGIFGFSVIDKPCQTYYPMLNHQVYTLFKCRPIWISLNSCWRVYARHEVHVSEDNAYDFGFGLNRTGKMLLVANSAVQKGNLKCVTAETTLFRKKLCSRAAKYMKGTIVVSSIIAQHRHIIVVSGHIVEHDSVTDIFWHMQMLFFRYKSYSI